MISQALPRMRKGIKAPRRIDGDFASQKNRFGKLKRLGQGAFGTAFSATLDSQKVIVKVSTGTRGMLSVPSAVVAMVYEIRVLIKLSRFPFVPVVVEVGSDYFVQEDVEGISLLDVLSKKGLEPRELLSVTVSLGIMASQIHRAGVAHADMEARNVLLTPRGVVLIDFGTALIRGEKPPAVLVLGATNFKEARAKDIVNIMENVVIVAGEDIPDNVRIILASTIEKYRKIVLVGRVTDETGNDLAKDLIFALAQMGARAKRSGTIKRKKVKVEVV